MATEAQVAANRRNAQRSTGPRTPEGKAAVARNATVFNLFSRHQQVSPEDEPVYNQLRDSFFAELSPLTPLEETWATEILRATWRLDCCAAAEARVGAEPHADGGFHAGIERARSEAHGLLERSINQLRRLQTERVWRNQFLKVDVPGHGAGLAEFAEVLRSLPAHRPGQMHTAGSHCSMEEHLALPCDPGEILARAEAHAVPGGAKPSPSEFTIQSQSASVPQPKIPNQSQSASAAVARNSLCPCGSGVKYKRCCGRNALPVLSAAA